MATISEALAIAQKYHQAGQLPQAAAIYRQILQADPNHAAAWHLLGIVAYQAGSYQVAVERIGRAIQLDGGQAEFHSNIGAAYQALGRPAEAIACHQRALQIKPDNAEAHNNLGNALKDQGQLPEAVACYRRAIQIKPDFVKAHCNLAAVLHEQGQLAEAIACYQRALQINPDLAVVHDSLGNAWKGQGRLPEAIACYQRALQIQPDLAGTHNNLGIVLQEQGQLAEAIACYRRAIRIQPDLAWAHDNLVLSLECSGDSGPTELPAAYAAYDRRHAAPLKAGWRPHANARDGNRALRLGFVSANFRRHAVGHASLRILESLRAEDCEITCYSTRPYQDDFAARFRATAHAWRAVQGIPDGALAEQIRADAIDVLFDLDCHFALNRLPLFARKPAPIQIALRGPVGTDAMDYLLADSCLVPAGDERYYREKLLRMPRVYTCYEPPSDAPEIGPPPAEQRGFVTFGSVNHNFATTTPQVIAAWSDILRRLPTARLAFRCPSLSCEDFRRRVLQSFADAGVSPDRLDLPNEAPQDERFDVYRAIDITLDPFPFTGGITMLESLWMGVPVITWPGETFHRRTTLAGLMNVGLGELAAHDLSDYIERAVALAQDLPRLATIRAGLRQRMAASPLCDGPRFAKDLMGLLHGVWRQWIQR